MVYAMDARFIIVRQSISTSSHRWLPEGDKKVNPPKRGGTPFWYNPMEGPFYQSGALPIEAHGIKRGGVDDIDSTPSVHRHICRSH
jgi:hypothetical protein